MPFKQKADTTANKGDIDTIALFLPFKQKADTTSLQGDFK